MSDTQEEKSTINSRDAQTEERAAAAETEAASGAPESARDTENRESPVSGADAAGGAVRQPAERSAERPAARPSQGSSERPAERPAAPRGRDPRSRDSDGGSQDDGSSRDRSPERRSYGGRSGPRRDSGGGRGRPGGRYKVYFRKKVCKFCTGRAKINYMDSDALRRFTTERGKILPRRITGNCAKHQRQLAQAVKRARILALLPFVAK